MIRLFENNVKDVNCEYLDSILKKLEKGSLEDYMPDCLIENGGVHMVGEDTAIMCVTTSDYEYSQEEWGWDVGSCSPYVNFNFLVHSIYVDDILSKSVNADDSVIWNYVDSIGEVSRLCLTDDEINNLSEMYCVVKLPDDVKITSVESAIKYIDEHHKDCKIYDDVEEIILNELCDFYGTHRIDYYYDDPRY